MLQPRPFPCHLLLPTLLSWYSPDRKRRNSLNNSNNSNLNNRHRHACNNGNKLRRPQS